MKRFLTVILAVLLLGACTSWAEEAPAAVPEAESPAGTWYGEMNGFVITLTLAEDGTYTASVAGTETAQGTWAEEDGAVILDGDSTLPFTFIGKTLSNADSGLSLSRTEPETYVPAPVTDVSVFEAEDVRATFDFDGAWKSAYLLTNGTAVPASSLGDNTILYIEIGRVLIMGDLFGQIVADFALEDNTLQLEEEGMSFLIQMQEDGYVRFTVTAGEEELVYIMAPYLVEEFPFGEETDEEIPEPEA